ncbi:hypothetical protein BDV98DRAFT_96448 [Pterulicium gracile]|uniref:Nephrocystin 3-like N-terminal domain-containing protein n=1 Tax=Pterulicium gracile TaxID=1884261 RepID=A0A5C3QFQ0_9AGAR|nr:hypothetical protein BDV98DRAFT_96448 [Pterula gracilis]
MVVTTTATTNNFILPGAADDELFAAIKYLYSLSLDHEPHHDDAYDQHVPGTGAWFLEGEKYNRWKTERNANLACVGQMGSGKTVLSSLIIEDLRETYPNDTAVLFVYNDISRSARQSAHITLVTLFAQALERLPHGQASPAILRSLYRHRQIRPDSVPNKQTIKKDLTSCLGNFDRVFVVVDALDQATDRTYGSEELVKILATLKCTTVITSRLSIPNIGAHYEELQVKASPEALKLLITQTLDNGGTLQELLGSDSKFRDTVSQRVLDEADGIFSVCRCRLDYLRLAQTVADIKSRLEEAPKGLCDLYRRRYAELCEEDSSAVRLIYLLIALKDRRMGARAAMQYLGCSSWRKTRVTGEATGSPADHIRSISDVLSTCRGFLILHRAMFSPRAKGTPASKSEAAHSIDKNRFARPV